MNSTFDDQSMENSVIDNWCDYTLVSMTWQLEMLVKTQIQKPID